MKNETITRIVLILEIGAIILFHSLKSTPPVNDNHVDAINKPQSIQYQQAAPLVLTSVKQ
jgi:hypothetical protein